jgi:hypothetical protein
MPAIMPALEMALGEMPRQARPFANRIDHACCLAAIGLRSGE